MSKVIDVKYEMRTKADAKRIAKILRDQGVVAFNLGSAVIATLENEEQRKVFKTIKGVWCMKPVDLTDYDTLELKITGAQIKYIIG